MVGSANQQKDNYPFEKNVLPPHPRCVAYEACKNQNCYPGNPPTA